MINKCSIAQKFGENANPLYNGQGLKGHTGVDEACGYGTDVYALKSGVVYKILDDKHPANDGSGYWGVYIISQDKNGQYCEWQIGHLSKILCNVGDMVSPWTIIGQEGNHGQVYYGNTEITKAMEDAGDHRGSHRHWNKKIVTRQTASERESRPGVHLTLFGPAGSLYIDPQGFVYSINDYYNGYNGSVDPMADIDAGYADVNAHFSAPNGSSQPLSPQDEEVVEAGIRVATEAVQYPSLWDTVSALLQNLKNYLASKQ